MLYRLARLLAPPHCVGCGSPNGLLCRACGHVCYARDTAQSLKPKHWSFYNDELRRLTALGPLDGPLRELIHAMKYRHSREAAAVLAGMMVPWFPANVASCIVPVPTATIRIRQRGFDHTWMMAKALSRLTGVPAKRLLLRQSNVRQVGQNRQTRLTQAKNQYFALSVPPNASVVLIDDVVTTGATIMACATLLSRQGCEVYALVAAYEE